MTDERHDATLNPPGEGSSFWLNIYETQSKEGRPPAASDDEHSLWSELVDLARALPWTRPIHLRVYVEQFGDDRFRGSAWSKTARCDIRTGSLGEALVGLGEKLRAVIDGKG